MKNALLLLALYCLFFVACKKEETCSGCSISIVNSTQYDVIVKVDGVTKFTLGAFQASSISLPDDKGHRVQGDIQTGFAHSDLDATAYCGPLCNGTTLTVRL